MGSRVCGLGFGVRILGLMVPALHDVRSGGPNVWELYNNYGFGFRV